MSTAGLMKGHPMKSNIIEELKAEEERLRGIRADRREGAGHNFGKSGLAKRARGESDKAPMRTSEGHSMTRSNIIDLELQLHHRTNMAVLVSDDGDRDKAVWLPLSMIEIEECANGTCIVTLPEFFAIDKGLV